MTPERLAASVGRIDSYLSAIAEHNDRAGLSGSWGYSDIVHGFNMHELRYSDLRALRAEVERWWSACDALGLPHSPEALATHCRATGAFVAGTQAYTRVRDAEAEVDRLRAQVAAVADLHERVEVRIHDCRIGTCDQCGHSWPCPTTVLTAASGDEVQP